MENVTAPSAIITSSDPPNGNAARPPAVPSATLSKDVHMGHPGVNAESAPPNIPLPALFILLQHDARVLIFNLKITSEMFIPPIMEMAIIVAILPVAIRGSVAKTVSKCCKKCGIVTNQYRMPRQNEKTIAMLAYLLFFKIKPTVKMYFLKAILSPMIYASKYCIYAFLIHSQGIYIVNRSLSIIKQTLNSNPVSIRLMYMALVALAAVSVIFGIAHAESQTELLHIGDSLALEKTVLNFQVNPNNNLPWGYVQGKVANHAEGYPVIIQIYSENLPVHFAQADVAEDGTYEYKFRVRNVDGENVVNIFKGEYSVIVTKVVKLSNGGWI